MFPRQSSARPVACASPGWRWTALGLAASLALSACNEQAAPASSTAPASTPEAAAGPAPQPTASYTPPSADTLYQMVAPIALYPDKLVAQVLAAATYPDQVAAAEVWLGQNPGMQKAAFATAVNTQPWDPAVKSLTQFPNVLEQLAANLPWTTALGKVYYNDPADVLNAIQVMRGRAYQAGTLKNSKQLRVSVASQPSPQAYTPGVPSAIPLVEPVITPPEQFIEIAPSTVDTVYVPRYDPGVIYGSPMPAYEGYRYLTPPPVIGIATPVVAGLIGFGAGVLLTRATDSQPAWGWHAWNMHWGAPGPRWRPGTPPPPPQARPAVVYRNETYVSQSRTVVQNNVHVNNFYGGAPAQRSGAPAAQPAERPEIHGGGVASTALAVGAVAGVARAAHGNTPPMPPASALHDNRPGASSLPPQSGRPQDRQARPAMPAAPLSPASPTMQPPRPLPPQAPQLLAQQPPPRRSAQATRQQERLMPQRPESRPLPASPPQPARQQAQLATRQQTPSQAEQQQRFQQRQQQEQQQAQLQAQQQARQQAQRQAEQLAQQQRAQRQIQLQAQQQARQQAQRQTEQLAQQQRAQQQAQLQAQQQARQQAQQQRAEQQMRAMQQQRQQTAAVHANASLRPREERKR